MQTIGYLYNERGWLRQANAPRFNMVLSYNADANKSYNGNIMYQFWGVPGNLSNHYTYTYDKLNRLTSGITSADNFQESGITYDTQGNLTALNRYSNGSEIDQLSYSYTVSSNPTNQLQSVADANASNSGLVSGTTNYTYDGNGNMLAATNSINNGQNKNITYNLLNLPLVVTVPNGTDTYTYDAAGNKLRMVKVIGGATTNTDYIGGIQYNGSTSSDTLSFIQTEEGKAVHNGTTYDYQYYLGDNLGNTRITFNTKKGIAKTIQQDDYYPFGLEILRAGPHDTKNEYLYNKKELQEDFTEYDYGARFYDPVIGRWTSLDPLAEVSRRWSTYNYVEDNPIRLIDPDGMSDVAEDLNNDIYNAEQRSDNRAADQQLINIASAASAIGNVGAAIAGASGSEGQPPTKKKKAQAQPADNSNRATIKATDPNQEPGPADVYVRQASQLDPVSFGGGDLGYGVVPGIFQGFKVAPYVFMPELTLSEFLILGEETTIEVTESGVTVIGKTPGYLEYAEKIGANAFHMPEGQVTDEELKVLCRQALDRAVARGDKIILDKPIFSVNEQTGGLRDELDYLINVKGYHLNANGTQMIK